jgi:16S rRNA (adenine1518-N6/adenine1519-N6)-dimethyltransferase
MGRRLGQHFLVRDSILHRIAAAVCPAAEAHVIEIGPGRGALTRHLLPRCERLTAIELDDAFPALLRDKFAAFPHFEVLHQDVLETDLTQWGPVVLAGNLPYYITSPILDRVLAMGPLMRRAVFLVQREVAERITAAPGSRAYGYLTVQVNFFAHSELLFLVPPAAFQPSPKVESAVIRLRVRTEQECWNVKDTRGFLTFLSRCFWQKRKMLRSNLAGTYPKDLVNSWPEAALRAEQIPLARMVELYRALEDWESRNNATASEIR